MENEKRNQIEQPTAEEHHDKKTYIDKIRGLSAEDQAFLDGYLFAKVTEAAKKGA